MLISLMKINSLNRWAVNTSQVYTFVIKRRKNAKENSVNVIPLLGETEIKATSFWGGSLLFAFIHNFNHQPNKNDKYDKTKNPAISIPHSPTIIHSVHHDIF